MKPVSNVALIALVEKLISEEPYDFEGHKWAARSNAFYCEATGLSPSTLGRMTRAAPFVRWRKLVGGELIDGKWVGGKMTCLLRIGVAGPNPT